MKPHTGGKNTSDMCNSCRLLAPRLNKIINETYETGNEMAIAWCIEDPVEGDNDPELIKPIKPYESRPRMYVNSVTTPVTGDEGSVPAPTIKCKDNDHLAHFHTHPNGDMRLSSADYVATFVAKREVACSNKLIKPTPENLLSLHLSHLKYTSLQLSHQD